MHKGIGISVVIAILALPLAAPADAPSFIPVQGFLTDADGTPVNGETVLKLSLYAGASAQTPLFSEIQTVMVDDGFFTLFVGQVETLDLLLFKENGSVVLGITVGEEDEMIPRLDIGSIPYAGFAQYAGDAATLGGMAPSDFRAAADDVSWDDLADVPAEISDGDSDSLGALVSCAGGQLAKWDGTAWGCADDIDTILTESDVDMMVADNGYALEADLAAVAVSGDFVDLLNVPADLLDGDNDTLGALTSCTDGQLAKWNEANTSWECADDVDTDNDTLGALTSCTLGQVAKWNDSSMSWECADDVDTGYTSEAELTALLDDNYLPAGYLPDWVNLQNIPADIADGDDTGYTSEAELTALLDDNYLPSSYLPDWNSLQNVPAGFADGIDNDTQLSEAQVENYVTNGPIDLSAGTTLNAQTISTGPHTSSLPWGSISGRPAGLDDGDDDTTYTAGNGLQLSGTTFSLPDASFNSWGSGTKTHYVGNGYVLESTSPSNLRIRITESGVFFNLGMEYPTTCGTPNTIGSVNRFSLTAGDFLDASFCGEGSMIFALVSRNPNQAGSPDMFRCWRSYGNGNNCQRL